VVKNRDLPQKRLSQKKECFMKNTVNCFGIMVLVFGMLFASCGTIMKKKAITVNTESGTAAEVRIEQDGVNLYSGPLPARINVRDLSQVNPLASINVHYTDNNGNPAVFEIKKSFNWWFIGSTATLVFWVVDIITGSVYTYNFSNTKVPISFNYDQPETELWFIEGIPPQMMEHLVFVGNMD
jgi:hypothetical protein